MNKNTVKPGLRRKRTKRDVENAQFDGFARRILRAYARRVAAGDVEALRSLVAFGSEVDTATREAVAGLKGFGYSWQEIADRLGVSRQAAQMRYGNATERGAIDKRILDTGLTVTLPTLVAVFADHCRGIPATSVCPGCGHRFDPDDTLGDCPTNQVVRPLLRQRKTENLAALKPLNPTQMAELAVKPRPRPRPVPTQRSEPTAGLFNVEPYRRKGGLR
jgi:hypothetical protein